MEYNKSYFKASECYKCYFIKFSGINSLYNFLIALCHDSNKIQFFMISQSNIH